MHSLIVEVNEDKYLIRYKVFKSVVSRKATKEDKITQQLEKHPSSCEVYLYKIKLLEDNYINGLHLATYKKLKKEERLQFISYLGRGLSKCSDKDKFDKNLGIRVAISNIENLDLNTKHNINNKILSTKL